MKLLRLFIPALMTLAPTVAFADESPAREPLVLQLPAPTQIIHPIRDRDGNPVFLRELYTLRRLEDFRIARTCGFNAVIEDGAATVEHAEKTSFHVTDASWYSRGFDPQVLTKEINRLRKADPVIAYNLNDEPDLRVHKAGPEVLAEAARAIRRLDPDTPLSVTLAGWSWSRRHWPAFIELVDIVRVDPYPLVAGRPLDHVRELVALARETAGPEKPIVAILQAWTWNDGPFPTAAQARQMVWQAIISGANGLSWFDWNFALWDEHPEFWRELIAINGTLQYDLGRLLTIGRRSAPVEAGDVYAATWEDDFPGRRILLCRLGNTEGERRVRLRLPTNWGTPKLYLLADRTTLAELAPLPDRTYELRLPELAAVLLSDRPIHARSPALGPSPVYWGLPGDPPIPDAVPAPDSPRKRDLCYRTDLAGRPLVPVSRQTTPELEPFTPYSRLGAAFQEPAGRRMLQRHAFWAAGRQAVDSPFSRHALTFQITPGQLARLRLYIETGRSVSGVFPHAWHDTKQWIPPDELDTPLVLEAVPPTDAADVGSPIPFEGGDEYRLKLELAANRIWATHRDHLLQLGTTGIQYGDVYQILRFRIRLPEPTPADPAKPAPPPPSPKTATAPYLGGLSLVAPWAELWNRTGSLPPLEDFRYLGSAGPAPRNHRAWLAYDDHYFYWFMNSDISPREFRASVVDPSPGFEADNLRALLLAPPDDDSVHIVRLNALGAAHTLRIVDDTAEHWPVPLQTRHRVVDKQWQMVVAIPRAWLPLAPPRPTEPSELRINIVTGRSVAPRVRAAWAPLPSPFAPATGLVRLHLRPK